MTTSNKLLQTVVIPRYITRICTSKKRRAKFYKKGDAKIPKKYAGCEVDAAGFLINTDGDRIISNPRVAGKAKYETLSGNKLTSGYSSPHIRNKIAGELKDFYRPFVRCMSEITEFPLRMEWELHTTVDRNNFDLSNLWFYLKYFEDTMVAEGIIPDDSIQFITASASPTLFPVHNFWERQFVFKIYHDDREILSQFTHWSEHLAKETV